MRPTTHARRLLRLLPLLALLVVLVFPPWMQDDPDAPMREIRGTAERRGHAFFLTPPAPAIAWDSRIYAPPASVPVEVDRRRLAREAVTALVVVALAVHVALGAPASARSGFPGFGARTFAVAGLIALVAPFPMLGPLASQPLWLLLDSNHGLYGWQLVAVLWGMYAFVLYLVLAFGGAVTRAARA